MTYFQFDLLFLGLPIVILTFALRRMLTKANIALIGTLMLVALVYTTPWDNYLVASKVWWYDPALVTGFTVGWVPIEEYTFIVLQPILAVLAALLIGRSMRVDSTGSDRPAVRLVATALLAIAWVIALLILLRGWMPGNYLALILIWALPPIALQMAFGADILLRQWRHVMSSLILVIAYLSAADALAIRSGIWTINPDRTLGAYIGNVLPIEEVVFFVVTNILLVFSVVLVQSASGVSRIRQYKPWLSQRFASGLTQSTITESE